MSEKHFKEQQKHSVNYLIPYFEEKIKKNLDELSIIEIGCAEGGFIDVLQQKNKNILGIEIETHRLSLGKKINPELNIQYGDITDESLIRRIGRQFDLVIIRDVIEHIENKEKVFNNIRQLLNPNGLLYITFPPKFSPFAGHQQNANGFLKYIPYIHLFPNFFIKIIGRYSGESNKFIDEIITNYYNGLSIFQFKKILKQFSFKILDHQLFVFRPVFETRFGLSPMKFPKIPVLQEIFALGCETILIKE